MFRFRGIEDFIEAVRPQPGGNVKGRKRSEADRRPGASIFSQPALADSSSGAAAGKGPMSESFPDAWKSYCASNPRLRDPRTLPALIRRDLPNELRREVWAHCLGVDPGELSGQLPTTEVSELADGTDLLIEADLSRTFPNSTELQEAGGSDSLRRMLRHLAVIDPDLGYCQSLNFLAAVLLMVLLNEGVAVLALQTVLVKLGTRSWYTDSMRQLRADTSVLEDLVKERLPGVSRTFRAHNFDMLFVVAKWFLALFSTTLEGETLRRVWDVMLCDGIEAVFRVAFALIHRRAEDVMRAESIDEVVMLFQGMQSDWSPEVLLRVAYSPTLIGTIGRAELAQRRKAAADRISSSDGRAEILNSLIWRGGVQPASALARTSRP